MYILTSLQFIGLLCYGYEQQNQELWSYFAMGTKSRVIIHSLTFNGSNSSRIYLLTILLFLTFQNPSIPYPSSVPACLCTKDAFWGVGPKKK